MTFAGWVVYGKELIAIFTELESCGVIVDAPYAMAALRLLLMVVGTLLTLVFLYRDRQV